MQRRSLLSLAVAASLLSPAAVLAQTAPASAPAPAAQQSQGDLDKVIVTGTRASNRTVASSAAPIDIITPETLEATGTTELATALARALPSLNFPRPAITDGTDAVRPAQLRGLAPDQVLVLVNGKRRHTTALINLNGSQGRGSSPVDLNAIPISAIDHVEVLRDGASAQYGSDAIAGVINVVLKKNSSGGDASARYGQYKKGDGKQWNLGADAGFKLGSDGFFNVAVQGGHQDNTNRATPYNGVVEQRYGDPEVKSGAFSYNAELPLADGISLYSFSTYSRRNVLSNGYFRWAGDIRNDRSIYPNGFLPQIHNVSKDVASVLGLHASASNGWFLDFSVDHGYNDLSFNIENTLNRSLGSTSPHQFYAGSLHNGQTVFNADATKDYSVPWMKGGPLTVAFGLEWRKETFESTPGEPNSYADTGLMIPALDANGNPTGAMVRSSGGSQVFAGFKPQDTSLHSRTSRSLYLDLEGNFTDKFSGGLAVRNEHYSDFGDTTTGKLSLRYAFSPKFALRGTASTGFRAPSLQQQYFQSTSTNFVGGVPYDIVTFRVDNPVAIALGAQPLKPEKSTNYGLGAVIQPMARMYLTIDAYQVTVKDRIYLSENLLGPVGAYLATQGIFNVNGGRYFTNALDTRTRGIDVVGGYRWKLTGGSSFDLTAGYNTNRTTIQRISPTPAALSAVGIGLQTIGRTEQGRVQFGAPRNKFSLNGTWKGQHWTASATATRYGEFTSYGTTAATDQTYKPKWVADLSLGYRVKGWEFSVGADNVFDTYPDRSIPGFGTRTYLPYSTQSPFGFNGAFYYGKVSYSWK
ncbi:TonB-dependent receptor plug domain-containing protein [Solilutibacter silvestris]|uniref:TonB dependent receptor n=1 Tax=Solilutibacter silvestris TaxID=1645665 RepID=A0A2K1Q2Q3_9GAMM|nr:TonB-dependent receptor [Lysobacter silvestris]PNS09330.1 TonB dependent receptor [Lysobacter silvestris]